MKKLLVIVLVALFANAALFAAEKSAPSSEYLGFVLGSQTLEDVEEILKKAGADYDLGGYRGYA
ncbi:MAG: hypothetical protein LBU73_06560, partial [Helicobacteraceae bacterium]|nr:hypothetical protein [Helicobacteraceae bacterium]